MLDDVHSSMLAQWLKKKIRAHQYYSYKLRLLANCMTYADSKQGVQIISNGKDSRIIGPRPCNHSWACPECTARVMRKYSTRIAAAIDALAKKGYAATMFTFTVFHSAMMSCEDTFLLLNKAWYIFDKNKTWSKKRKEPLKRKQHNNIEGDTYKSGGTWSKFYQEFECNHTVKTLETTYGKHGWHPHIHMLIWVKNEDLQKLADWEEKLNEAWAVAVDKAAKIIYKDNEHSYEVRKFLEAKTDREDSGHLGLHISKTTDGKIKRWSSGDYLCGWGGENELTGLGMKTARKDNMSPFQMLEKAHELETTDIIQSNRLIELYLHFAYTVIKHRISRIQFSRTGLKAIIDTHLQTEEFKAVIKKKKERLSIAAYQNIAWFTKKQWCNICCSDNPYLIPLILHFAKIPEDPVFGTDGYYWICELCIANNLDPPCCTKHPAMDIAKSFNELIAA